MLDNFPDPLQVNTQIIMNERIAEGDNTSPLDIWMGDLQCV
jgi:hypothetical protein